MAEKDHSKDLLSILPYLNSKLKTNEPSWRCIAERGSMPLGEFAGLVTGSAARRTAHSGSRGVRASPVIGEIIFGRCIFIWRILERMGIVQGFSWLQGRVLPSDGQAAD